MPYLQKTAERVYPADAVIVHELMGSRAVRQGNWKITDRGNGRWLLFNIVKDPGETKDLSDTAPETKARLTAAYESYARDVGVIMREDRPFHN